MKSEEAPILNAYDDDYNEGQLGRDPEPKNGSLIAYRKCSHRCINCATDWECAFKECIFSYQRLAICGTCYIAQETLQ